MSCYHWIQPSTKPVKASLQIYTSLTIHKILKWSYLQWHNYIMPKGIKKKQIHHLLNISEGGMAVVWIASKAKIIKKKGKPYCLILPVNINVKNNMAKMFIKFIDKNFANLLLLKRLFNRNNVNVSHSCTNSIEKIMTNRNRNIMERYDSKETHKCSCIVKEECLLNRACLVRNVV